MAKFGPSSSGLDSGSNFFKIPKILKENKTASLKMKDEDCILVAKGLKHNITLKELNLSENYIGDEGANALYKVLKENDTLKKINLMNNHITVTGVEKLYKIGKSKNVTILIDFENLLSKKQGIIDLKREYFEQGPQSKKLKLKEEDGNEVDLSQKVFSLESQLKAQYNLIEKMNSEFKFHLESQIKLAYEPTLDWLIHLLGTEEYRAPAVWILSRAISRLPFGYSPDSLNFLFSNPYTLLITSILKSRNSELQRGLIILLSICFLKYDHRGMFSHIQLVYSLTSCPILSYLCLDIVSELLQRDITMKFLIKNQVDENDNLLNSMFLDISQEQETSNSGEIIYINYSKDIPLRMIIQDSQSLSTIESKAEKVGALISFVHEKMGGEKATTELVNFYLRQLSAKFGAKIPLGEIVFGSSRHRALLFKILCDFHEIPSKLIRTKVEQDIFMSWNSVCISSKEKNDTSIDVVWEDNVSFLRNNRGLVSLQKPSTEVINHLESRLFGYEVTHPDNLSELVVLPLQGQTGAKAVSIAEYLGQFQHDYLVKTRKVSLYNHLSQPSLLIEIESRDGLLSELIENRRKFNLVFDLEIMSQFAFQIASGMAYLHSPSSHSSPEICKSLHLSLNPQTIIWHDRGGLIFKIKDFGWATMLNEKHFLSTLNQFPTTKRYLAPELQDRGSLDGMSLSALKTCDVYSFGLVVAELVTLQAPRPIFPPYLDSDFPSDFPPWFKTIIFTCLSEVPQRKSFAWIKFQLKKGILHTHLAKGLKDCFEPKEKTS